MNCNPHFRFQLRLPTTVLTWWHFPPFLTVQAFVGLPVTMSCIRLGRYVCLVPRVSKLGPIQGSLWAISEQLVKELVKQELSEQRVWLPRALYIQRQ